VAPTAGSGGIAGTLGGTLVLSGSLFSSGAATSTDLDWDDVGIISLTGNILDADYLGAGNVSSTSGNIGRFTPDHLATAVTPACTAATDFTYSGQHADVTVSAMDLTNDVTVNYDFNKGYSKSITLSNGGDATGFSLNTLITGLTSGIGIDTDVIHTFAAKSTPPTTLTIRAVDTDGISSQGFSEGAELVYSGRLSLQNASGSELLNLTLPLEAQYWMGSYYVTNTDDSCTQITVPSVGNGLTFGGNLTAAMTALSLNGVSSGMSSLVQGLGNLVWTKPGAGNTGYVDMIISSPNWLKFDWNGTGDTNPSARATFGIYKGNSKIIYIREVY
jgi:MSHA biogenesis protein MshQ